MRKLFLTSAFVLASVAAAHAGPSRSLVLAAADTPVAAEAAEAPVPPPQPPATQARPALTPVEAAAQVPAQADQPQATPAETPKQHASRPAKKSPARNWESDEHKARRIAAHYGIYW